MRQPKRKDSVQRGVEGSGERFGLVLGRKVVGQRLKSMKIRSVIVVSSGGEASEGGGGVVVVRESEVVERRRRVVVVGEEKLGLGCQRVGHDGGVNMLFFVCGWES